MFPPRSLSPLLPFPLRLFGYEEEELFFVAAEKGGGEKETEMAENGDGGGRTPTRVCSLSLSLSTSFPHFRKRSAVLCQFSFFPLLVHGLVMHWNGEGKRRGRRREKKVWAKKGTGGGGGWKFPLLIISLPSRIGSGFEEDKRDVLLTFSILLLLL